MNKIIRDMRDNFNDVVAQVIENDKRVKSIVEYSVLLQTSTREEGVCLMQALVTV